MSTSTPGVPAGVEAVLPIPPDIDPGLDGLSGWLILPAIGLIFGLVTGAAALLFTLGLADDIGSGWFAFALLVDGGMFLLTVVTAAAFFRKRASTPGLYIALLWATVATSVLLVVVISAEPQDVGRALGGGLAAVIWTIYFQRSKRVKATFRR